MKKVGLTGGIGSGKTTISKIFGILGIPVFNSDDEAKFILAYNQNVHQLLREHFGNDAFSDNFPDRQKISKIVFEDPEKLSILNSIIHPKVGERFLDWIKQQQNAPYIIKEAAIIFETNIDQQLDLVINIESPLDLRMQRVLSSRGMQEKEFLLRTKNQMTDEERSKRSNFVIYNDEKHLLIKQILEIHQKIMHD